MKPTDYLPLTPVAFEILLALGKGDLHGYAIMQTVNENAPRAVHPGTLYRAMARLVEQGMLAEEEGASADRRRVYRLTAEGREVAAAETARLSDQLSRAVGFGSAGRAREA